MNSNSKLQTATEISNTKEMLDVFSNWSNPANVFRRIFRHHSMGMLVTSNNSIVHANNYFCDLLGYDVSEMIHRPLVDFTKMGEFPNPDIEDSEQRGEGSPYLVRTDFITKNGKSIILDATIYVVYGKNTDKDDKVIIVDVYNEQAELEEQLNETLIDIAEKDNQLNRYKNSNSQLENFAYVASHDLREPLRTIGNFSQLLSKRIGNDLDEVSQEYFKFIVDGVQNMNLLINDLLTYSRVNIVEDVNEKIKLNDCLFMIVRSLDKNIKEHNAVINFENIPDIIYANKTKIKQLFQNLIANAIKFRKETEPPVILIRGEDCGKLWKFTIEDNGIGIKEEFYEKIFLLFKKLHSKQEYQGSGIGLALCKKIVEQHDGDIWLESKLGEGTTFYFTLKKYQTVENKK